MPVALPATKLTKWPTKCNVFLAATVASSSSNSSPYFTSFSSFPFLQFFFRGFQFTTMINHRSAVAPISLYRFLPNRGCQAQCNIIFVIVHNLDIFAGLEICYTWRKTYPKGGIKINVELHILRVVQVQFSFLFSSGGCVCLWTCCAVVVSIVVCFFFSRCGMSW